LIGSPSLADFGGHVGHYEAWLASRHSPPPVGAMRVGPGTDAVVWKICDTNETVEL
jgi:hypothetical protein